MQSSKISANAWHAHEAHAVNVAWLAQRNRANLAMLGEQVGGGAGYSKQPPQVAHADKLIAVVRQCERTGSLGRDLRWRGGRILAAVTTVTDMHLCLLHDTTLAGRFSDSFKSPTFS
jgi:hypothetical protein